MKTRLLSRARLTLALASLCAAVALATPVTVSLTGPPLLSVGNTAGTNQTFTVTVANPAGDPARNVRIQVWFPSLEYAYIAGSSLLNGLPVGNPTGSGTAGDPYVWTLAAPVNAGASAVLTFRAGTSCSAAYGRVNARALYDDNQVPPNAYSTSASPLAVSPLRGFLKVTFTPETQNAGSGDTVNWTVTAINSGNGAIYDGRIYASIGAGFSGVVSTVSTNAGSPTSLPALQPGDQAVYTVSGVVSSCQDLANTAYTWWGCGNNDGTGSLANPSNATASIFLDLETPDLQYTGPTISVPYCGSVNVDIPLTNTGDGPGYSLQLRLANLPVAFYQISNLGAGWSRAGDTFTWSGTLNAGQTIHLTFTLAMPSGSCNTAAGSASLICTPSYQDLCGNTYQPPIQLGSIAVSGSGGSITVAKSGPGSFDTGQTGLTYTVTVTYNQGGCSQNTITVPTIRDTFPAGYLSYVSSTQGGSLSGSSVVWNNVVLTSGVPWTATVTMDAVNDPCNAGTTCSNTAATEGSLADCCGCTIPNGSASVTAYVNNPLEGPLSSSDATVSPATVEICSDTQYTVTFQFTGSSPSSWCGIVFNSLLNNGQTFVSLDHVYVNGTDYVARFGGEDVTGLDLCPLDAAPSAPAPSAAVMLQIVFTLRMNRTDNANSDAVSQDFIAWSTLQIPGSSSGCVTTPETYYQGVPVTAIRGDLGVGVNLPSILDVCETINAVVSFTRNGYQTDQASLTVDITGYEYVGPAAFSGGGAWCSGTKGEPAVAGDLLQWSSAQIGDVTANGTVTLPLQKRCAPAASTVSATVPSYRDRCSNTHSASGSATPVQVFKAVLSGVNTPEKYYSRYPNETQVRWKVYILNTGTGTARNVTLTQTLNNLHYDSYTASPGITVLSAPAPGDSPAVWVIDALDPGARCSIEINATATSCAPTTSSRIQWGCPVADDCQLPVNVAGPQIIFPLEGVVSSAIQITDPIPLCGTGRVQVTYRNAGKVRDYNMDIVNNLPNGVCYVTGTARIGKNNTNYATMTPFEPALSGGGQVLTWAHGTSGPGTVMNILEPLSPPESLTADAITVSYDIRADCDVENGGILNTLGSFARPCEVEALGGIGTGATGTGVADQAQLDFRLGIADLDIIVIPDTSNALLGSDTTITIRLRNNSPYPAENITLTDVLPANAVFVGCVPAATSAPPVGSTGTIVWGPAVVGTIMPAAQSDFQLTYRITGCTPLVATNNITANWGCGSTNTCDGAACQFVRNETHTSYIRSKPSLVNFTLSPLAWNQCAQNVTVQFTNQGPDASGMVLNCTLPANTQYTALVSSSHALSAQPAAGDTTLAFAFNGAIVETETVTVVFSVTNLTACFAGGTVSASLNYGDSCGNTFSDVTLSSAVTALTPSIAPPSGAPYNGVNYINPLTQTVSVGGTASWTLGVRNSGTAATPDPLTITYTLGTALTITATGGGVQAGQVITFTVPAGLAPGATWTSGAIQATAGATADPNQLSSALSLGASCGACTWAAGNQTTYVTLLTSFSKTLDASSTATPTIGNTVSYVIQGTLQGSYPYTNIQLQDTLPAGMSYVVGGHSSLVFDTVPPGAPASYGEATWNAGPRTLTWSGINETGPKTFRATITAYVTNDAANVAGRVLDNVAVLTYVDNGQPYTYTDNEPVTVRVPSLTTSKARSAAFSCGCVLPTGTTTVNANDVVGYRLRVANAAGANVSTAYDIQMQDLIPVGMRATAPVVDRVELNAAALPTSAYTTNWNAGTGVLLITLNAPGFTGLPAGQNLDAYVMARVDGTVGSCQTLTNTFTMPHAYTLPNDSPDLLYPTVRRDIPSNTNRNQTVTAACPSVTKTASATTVTRGDVFTYTIAYTVPAGTSSYDTAFTDTLPAGLTVLSVTTTHGTAPVAPFGNPITINNIGDLTSPAAGPPVVVTVTIQVRVDQTFADVYTITNTGRFNYNRVNGDNSTATNAQGTANTPYTNPVITVTKTDTPDPVSPGQILAYTLNVAVTGGVTARNVQVSDTWPNTRMSYLSATPAPAVPGAQPLTWNLGDLPSGSTTTLTVFFTVNSPMANGTTFTNNVSATATNPHAASVLSDAEATTVQSSPGLQISKVDSPDPVNAGQNLTYTFTYANLGTQNATGVVISETIPAGTTFVSASNGGAFAAGVVTWNLGNLAAGATGAVTLILNVNAPAVDGSILNNTTYTIDSNETPPVAGAPVTTTVRSPILAISKVDSVDPVSPGALLTYTLSYQNTGGGFATSTVITDNVPADTTFVSAANGGALVGSTVVWNLGTLMPGASGTVSFTVRVNNPLPNGTVLNNTTYGIDSAEVNPVPGAPVTTTVVSAPVISIVKVATPSPVAAGANLTYTLTYANTGTDTATGVVITDTVPANTTFLSATPPGVFGGGVVTWALPGNLAAGASGSVSFTVQVASPLANGTQIQNTTYAVDSSETPPSPGPPVQTPVTSAPLLTISKTDAPDPVLAGQLITYTLVYANTGTDTATGVVITDTIPVDTTFDSATGGGVFGGGVVTWAIGNVPAGGSGSVILRVRVSATIANGTVIHNNTYAIDCNETPPVPGAPVDTTTQSAPVLNVSKTAAPNPVTPGQNITYTLTYGNTGSDAATNVVLQDLVPAHTTFVSATGGGTHASGVVTWNLGSLAPGATGSVQFVVQTDTPLPNGTTIVNSGYTIHCDEVPPVQGNPVTVTVQSAPVLTIGKADTPDPVTAGGTLTYTLTYSNTGNDAATGVVITDSVPAQTTFLAASGGGAFAAGTVTWNVGTVPAGATGNVSFTVQVDSPLADGTTIANNSYAVDSNETPPVSGPPVATTVTSAPALCIHKAAGPNPVQAGDELTYLIVYGNTGTDTATNVVITDTVPANTSFVSASDGGTESGGVVTWTIGNVLPGDRRSVRFVVRIDTPLPDGTVVDNDTYGIDSDETPYLPGQPVSVTVNSQPQLSVTKTAVPNPVQAGGQIVYTLSYANTGTDAATGVVITDTLPADTAFVSATNGGTLVGPDVVWNLGVLPAGGSGTVSFTVDVAEPLPDNTSINNTAYAIDCNEEPPVTGPPVAVIVDSAPVLTVSKVAAPNPVTAGGLLTYTLTYTNTGNADATNATLQDVVPPNTTFDSATGGGTESNGMVTWNVGTVGIGTSGSVSFTVRVNTPIPDGTLITNSTYLIACDEVPPVPGNPVSVTVQSAPVLTVTKTDSPDPVSAGGTLTYTLTWSNTGTAQATNVVVTDTVPLHTTFLSASHGGMHAGGVVTWNLGTLPAGSTGNVSFTVLVETPLADGTVLQNAGYAIDSDQTPPVVGPPVDTTVTSGPVLAIFKAAGPNPVQAGSIVTYALSVVNSGTDAATAVVVTDTVPAGTTFQSATDGGTLAAGIVTWNLGVLAPGAQRTVQMYVQVNAPVADGTVITNTNYGAGCAETPPVSGPPVTVTVQSSPLLMVTKTAAPDPVNAGQQIVYTLTWANVGTDTATGVVLTDPVPALTTFVSATGGGILVGGVVTWNLPDLPAGSSGSVQFTVQVNTPIADGTGILNAGYAIDCTETPPSVGPPVTVPVRSDPALSVTKTAAPSPVAAGGNLTYTLSFGNSGNDTATGVVLTDVIPQGTTFLSADNGGTYAAGIVTWNLGSLAVGASGTVSFTVRVDVPVPDGTLIRNNTYAIGCNEVPPVSGPPVQTPVVSLPVLSVTKSDAPDPVLSGGNLTYTLTYANTGDSAATNVTLNDTVPAQTTFVAASAGGFFAAGVVTWNVGTVPPLTSGTVSFTVQVDAPLADGTVLHNTTYSVDSDQTLPVSGPPVDTTVDSAPALCIHKAAGPDPVGADEDLTYLIVFGNLGTDQATNVVITDTVPADTTFVSASDGGTEAGGVVTWNVGTLLPGERRSVRLIVRVNDPLSNGTTLTNATFGIDSTETPYVPGLPVTVTVNSAPQLAVTKTASPNPVLAGGQITYTLTYTNEGTDVATGVTISDTVPADTTFVSADNGGGLVGADVVWNLGALAAGASGTVSFVVQVNTPLPDGTSINNLAYSIDCNEQPPVTGPPVAVTVSSAPALGISKTASPDPVLAGGQITYVLTYTNTGSDQATNLVVQDIVPAHTTFVSADNGGTESGGMVTWNPGTLAVGASGTVSFVVQVDAPLPDGTTIVNGSYIVRSDEVGPEPGPPVTVTVDSAPVLSVTKVASPEPVAAGGNLTYTLTYRNTGTDQATNVVLTDQVPIHTTFVAASDGGSFAAGTVTWNLGTVPAGAVGSVTLTVRVDAPLANGTVVPNDTYAIDSTETPPAPGPPVNSTVSSGPSLSIFKAAGPNPVRAGQTLAYALAVVNLGTDNATNVVVTDQVPAGTTFLSATDGGTFGGGVVTWNLGTLAPGAQRTVQLLVTVDAPVPDGTTITNANYQADSTETPPVSGPPVTVVVDSRPLLTITKTAAPDPVEAGDTITYTLSYLNSGTDTATGVVVTDPVPAFTTFESATNGGTFAGGVVTWTVGSIPAGGSGTLQFVVRVNTPIADGTGILNSGYSIDSDQTTPAVGPPVTVTVHSVPAMNISKTAAPSPVPADTNLTYTLSYSNTGTDEATGVVIRDAVPLGTSFVSATAGGNLVAGDVVWNIGSVPAGGSGTVQFTVHVLAPVPNGTFVHNAVYSVDCGETPPVNGAEVDTPILSYPSLHVTKTDAPDPVAAGGLITYTLVYTNTGTDTATNVVISDPIPAQTTFVSASSGGTYAAGAVTWNLGALAAGGFGTASFTVRTDSPLPDGTQILNTGYTIGCTEQPPVAGPPVSTTISSAPVLSIVKTAAPSPVLSGDLLTYTLTYSNTGTDTALGTVITDPLPPLTTFVSATHGGTFAGGVVTWNLGSVPAGTTASVQFVVRIDSPLSSGTQITNSGYVIDCAQNPPVTGPPVTVVVQSSHQLAVTKTAAPNPVQAGGLLTYTLVCTCSGTAPVTNVVVTDPVPAHTTFVSATLGGTFSGGAVRWELGTLNPGDTRAMAFTVRVDSPILDGLLIVNEGYSADGDQTDPIVGLMVETPVESNPVLNVTKTASPIPVLPGELLTFTLSYANTGTDTAHNVVIRDPLPAHTTFVSATPGGVLAGGIVTWTVGDVAVGSGGSVQLVVRVDAVMPPGVPILNNGYTISGPGVPPVTGPPVTVPVDTSRLLAITKTASPSPVRSGEFLTYTLVCNNRGTVTANGVIIRDTVPANTTFVSASHGGTESGGVVTWVVGTLEPGQSATVFFTVKVAANLSAGTLILNTGYTADCIEADPVVGEPVETPVEGGPELFIVKAGCSGPVRSGDILRYTITYLNAGTAAASNVTVSDRVPEHTTFVWACNNGIFVDGVVTWLIGTLQPGQSGTVCFDVRVDDELLTGSLIRNLDYSITGDELSRPVQGPGVDIVVRGLEPIWSYKTAALQVDANGDGVAGAGDTLRYTITFLNTGDAAATEVCFADVPDPNTLLVAGSVTVTQGTVIVGNAAGDTEVYTEIGTVPAPEGLVEVRYDVTIRPDLPPGVDKLTNQGEFHVAEEGIVLTDDPNTPVRADATTTVLGLRPAIWASKGFVPVDDVDQDRLVGAGDTLRFTIEAANTGNAPATGVVLTDWVDPKLELVENSVTTSVGSVLAGNEAGAPGVRVALGTLAAGSRATIAFDVKVRGPLEQGVTRVVNRGVVTADNLPAVFTDDPDTPMIEDRTVVPLLFNPRLFSVKEGYLVEDPDDNGVPSAGDTILYRVRVFNRGALAQPEIILEDVPDAVSTLRTGSVRVSFGNVLVGNQPTDRMVRVRIPSIEAGGEERLEFTVRVNPTLPASTTSVAGTGVTLPWRLPLLFSDDPATPCLEDVTEIPLPGSRGLDAWQEDYVLGDNDGNGLPTAGDRLVYRVRLSNAGAEALGGVRFVEVPVSPVTLVPGTVRSSRGEVTRGNSAGDRSVDVNVGGLQPGETVLLSFEATIAPATAPETAWVENQGLLFAEGLPLTLTDDPVTTVNGDATRTLLGRRTGLRVEKVLIPWDDCDGDGRTGPGDTCLVRIRAVNRGLETVGEVVIQDQPKPNLVILPGSVSADRGIIDEGNVEDDHNALVYAHNLPADESATVAFLARLPDPLTHTGDKASNQALVSGAELPLFLSDDPSTPPSPDPSVVHAGTGPWLRAWLTAHLLVDRNGDGWAGAGDTLAYRLVLRNDGNDPAADILATDLPENGTALVAGSVIVSRGTVVTGNNPGDAGVAIRLGEIEAGETVTASFHVVLPDPLPAGLSRVSNQAVAAHGGGQTPSDDPGTLAPDDATVTTLAGQPSVEVSKTDVLYADREGLGSIGPLTPFIYLFRVRNTGAVPLTGGRLVDTPGLGYDLLAGSVRSLPGRVVSGNTPGDLGVDLDLGTLTPGQEAWVHFLSLTDPVFPAALTAIENQAAFSTPQLGLVPSDDPETVFPADLTRTPIFRVSVTVDGAPNPVPCGGTVQVTVTWHNAGTVPVFGAVLSASWDERLSFVSVDRATDPGDRMVWSLGDLQPGASGTLHLTLQAGTNVASRPCLTCAFHLAANEGTWAGSDCITVQGCP